jgi:hypothetical protein
VLLPARNALRKRLAEECGNVGVPYV